MKAAIYPNLSRKNAYDVTVSVINELKKLKINIIMTNDVKEFFKEDEIKFLEFPEAIFESDLVISIGGDGTIIHSAQYASEFNKPILGINAGHLGFLAGLEKEELSLLKNLITGDYKVENRMMLSVSLYEGERLKSKSYCLNDVIMRGVSLRLSDFEISSGGINSVIYRADGVIVATPTGSTAYSLSAGGPVVDTAIESIVLTPICPHSLFSRSMIFSSDNELKIEIKGSADAKAVLSCDGKDGVEINEKNTVVIKKANRITKIIRIKADSFADILSKKFIGR